MKTTRDICAVLLYAILTLSVGGSFAQEKAATQLQADMIGTWLALIEGSDGKDRVLIVTDVSQKSEGLFALDARYGYLPTGYPVSVAEIGQTGTERKLSLTARSGAKIVASQTPDGAFVGSFFGTDGRTYPVKITRISEGDLRARAEASLKGPEIQKPAADVPTQCAAFSGRWRGMWTQGSQDSLWVVRVDANCLAQYAYLSGANSTPSNYESAEIKNGTLQFGGRFCARDGTCTFELHGDELWARYSNPGGGWGNAVFRKVQ